MPLSLLGSEMTNTVAGVAGMISSNFTVATLRCKIQNTENACKHKSSF